MNSVAPIVSDREEWLQWRHKGIGSSDAPAVHGASPYMTRLELCEIKIQDKYIEKETNFVQRRGNELEPIARTRFAALWNLDNLGSNEDFAPIRTEILTLPFMKASLDGCSKDGKTILELKFQSDPPIKGKELTQGQRRHQAVLCKDLHITGSDPNATCRVPYHYWIQIQHQLVVSGADRCFFGSFDGETLNTCEVLPDKKFMSNHLKACVDTWELIKAKKLPDPGPEDFKEIRVKGAKAKAQKWKRLKALIADYELEMDALKEDLIAMVGDHSRNICDGVRITQVKGRKGSIDWEKAFLATNLKLDSKFKKPDGKPYWKVDLA